jgi:hypothetical protein
MDWDTEDAVPEYIRIPRPRALGKILLDAVRLRSYRLMARERVDAIVDMAQIVANSGLGGQIISRDAAGGLWAVTVSSPSPARRAALP